VCLWGHAKGMYRRLFGSAWHGYFKPMLQVSGAHSFLYLLALHKAKKMLPRTPHRLMSSTAAGTDSHFRTEALPIVIKKMACCAFMKWLDLLLHLWRHRMSPNMVTRGFKKDLRCISEEKGKRKRTSWPVPLELPLAPHSGWKLFRIWYASDMTSLSSLLAQKSTTFHFCLFMSCWPCAQIYKRQSCYKYEFSPPFSMLDCHTLVECFFPERILHLAMYL